MFGRKLLMPRPLPRPLPLLLDWTCLLCMIFPSSSLILSSSSSPLSFLSSYPFSLSFYLFLCFSLLLHSPLPIHVARAWPNSKFCIVQAWHQGVGLQLPPPPPRKTATGYSCDQWVMLVYQGSISHQRYYVEGNVPWSCPIRSLKSTITKVATE